MLVGYTRQRDADDRALPQPDFDKLNDRFRFTVDAAASEANAKLPRYWTAADNGLQQQWAGERVYCNPPFSRIPDWITKAWDSQAELVVMLIPANRTEQRWWQTYIEPYRDQPGTALRVEFLPGRIRFLKPGQITIKPNERPPFGIALAIWDFSRRPPKQSQESFEF